MTHIASAYPYRNSLCNTLNRNRTLRSNVERVYATLEEFNLYAENLRIFILLAFILFQRIFHCRAAFKKAACNNTVVRRNMNSPGTFTFKFIKGNFMKCLHSRFITYSFRIRILNKAVLRRHSECKYRCSNYSKQYFFHYLASDVDFELTEEPDSASLKSAS